MTRHWVFHSGERGMRRAMSLSFTTLAVLCQLMGCFGPYIYTGEKKATTPRLETDSAVMIMADGYALPYVIFPANGTSSRAIVLALHGFNDYS